MTRIGGGVGAPAVVGAVAATETAISAGSEAGSNGADRVPATIDPLRYACTWARLVAKIVPDFSEMTMPY